MKTNVDGARERRLSEGVLNFEHPEQVLKWIIGRISQFYDKLICVRVGRCVSFSIFKLGMLV